LGFSRFIQWSGSRESLLCLLTYSKKADR
jgi:hypothetical protein